MYDIIIIGAGPAGLSAAIVCRQFDFSVLILDEFPKPGGRLLGQLHEEPNGEWWNGIDEAKKLLEEAEELQAEIKCHTPVHHIEKKEQTFYVHTEEKVFTSKKLLIATGAAETSVPIPGWTLPGVMSIGAAQVMTNVHRVKVGERGVVVGVNVLSAAIARELQLAGITLEGLFLPEKNIVTASFGHPKKVMADLSRIAHLAPSLFIRLGSHFIKPQFMQSLVVNFFPKKGIQMWDMPVHLRKAVTSINGTEKVESVTVHQVSPEGEILQDTKEEIPVDFVCIAGGLYPLAELAAVIGCPFRYVEELGGHVPIHRETMETPIDGVYVAGNITGIESAQVAMAQGTLAGWSIVDQLTTDRMNIDGKINEALENVRKTRAEATIQFHPKIDEGRQKIEAVFHENHS